MTHPSWQDWLVRRADEAYRSGSRGIKWDVATPDVPPGKTRADVNDAIASVMQRILEQHPDMKFVFNQGFEFALAYPQFVHGDRDRGALLRLELSRPRTSSRGRTRGTGGRSSQQVKALRERGIPVFVAEYADPFSQRGARAVRRDHGAGVRPVHHERALERPRLGLQREAGLVTVGLTRRETGRQES